MRFAAREIILSPELPPDQRIDVVLHELTQAWRRQLTTETDILSDVLRELNAPRRKHVWRTSFGGLGDLIVLSWIAQGANAAGLDVSFERRGTREAPDIMDRIAILLGQPLSDSPGWDVHANGGFLQGCEQPGHERLPRPILWQRRLGIDVTPQRPPINIPSESMEWAEKQRAPGKPLALAFPWAARPVRSWPTSKYVRLMRQLETDGWHTVALHSNGSQEDLKMFPRHLHGLPIEHVAALCKVAEVVVGNDSGATHLAGTLGTPTIAVCGSADPVTVFGYCPEIRPVAVSSAAVPCVGCQLGGPHFTDACNAGSGGGCEALHLLGWREVYEFCRR